jgi:hypothetical protein
VCLLLESGSRILKKKFNKTFATKVPAFFQQRAIEEGWSNQGFGSQTSLCHEEIYLQRL